MSSEICGHSTNTSQIIEWVKTMSSSLSARAEQFPNPFMEQAQAVVEFSRGLSSALKGANHQRKDAFFQFFTRQLPKQAIRELVPEFNKAVREYNRNRNKLKAMLTRGGGIQPEDKLFTVEENLKNAMRTFQRIKDLLLVYPKVKNEPARATAMNATARAGVNILKAAGYGLSAAIILASCAPPLAEVAPVPDQEDEEEKNPTQTAQDVIDGTQEGQEIDPATLEAPTADPLLEKVETGLGSNPNSQTSYVRALEIHNNESMVQACLDFVKRLDNRIDINYNTIGINQYGICYAKSDDGSQIIFDKWDANGPLYVTRAAGFDLLSKLNPQATDGKTEEDFSLEENAANTFAVLKDDQGNLTEVGVGINGQWGTTGSTELVATPTAPSANSETDLEEENLLTSNPEVISSMASDVLSGKTEFPIDLNPEQNSALIKEMNAQRGSKPVYVEAVDENNNPTVMYYNTETRQMETLKGTYEDNKEIIDQHGFDIYVEIGQNEQGLTTYVHPDTGEEIAVENSGGIDWDWVGDKSNINNGYIDPETLKNQSVDFAINQNNEKVVQVIVINKDIASLVSSQGMYFDYNCLETIIVRNKKLGIRTFIGPSGGMDLVIEGSSEEEALGRFKSSDQRKKIKENVVYYVIFEQNQPESWERSKQTMDPLENVADAKDTIEEMLSGHSTDGVVILRSPVIILRKNK